MKALLLIITLLSSFPLLAELEVLGHYKGIPIARSTPNQRRVNVRLRACTNKYFQSAIIAVSPEKSVTEATWVLDNCPKIDINQEIPRYAVDNWTPTHSAIFQGKMGLLKLFIDRGADLDEVSRHGTDLHNSIFYSHLTYAISQRETEAALALIKGGADVNKNVTGGPMAGSSSALKKAMFLENERVVEALLAAGADMDVCGELHTTLAVPIIMSLFITSFILPGSTESNFTNFSKRCTARNYALSDYAGPKIRQLVEDEIIKREGESGDNGSYSNGSDYNYHEDDRNRP